ncbi:hypothetical protein [Sodalis sp.]|uniref:hypothetical protein n=1 Tax=Sodalis sp. (in: enterobacteria) TaxID=1898979 RepID=UPI003873CA44
MREAVITITFIAAQGILADFNSVQHKERATAGRANSELFYDWRGTSTHFSLQQAMVEFEGGAGYALYPCGTTEIERGYWPSNQPWKCGTRAVRARNPDIVIVLDIPGDRHIT